MAFILPQVLAFLNDRKDAQLRSALFCHLPSVCRIVGRSATEHFVLPCLESGLVDGEEQVVGAAIRCLAELIELGLLSRSVLLGNLTVSSTPDSMVELASDGLLRKYGCLLVHPSADIRHGAIATINAACEALGSPDSEVYVAHLLYPFFRFLPSLRHLKTLDGMETCLYPSWSREKFAEELSAFMNSTSQQQTAGPWTSVGIRTSDSTTGPESSTTEGAEADSAGQQPQSSTGPDVIEAQVARVREYLQTLGRRNKQPSGSQSETQEEEEGKFHVLKNGIEGSLKLAQNIKFPRQDTIGVNKRTLPAWYSDLRDQLQAMNSETSETSAIRSVSALGEIYGLSIMAASDSTAESPGASGEETKLSKKEIQDMAYSRESKVIEGVCSGEWGSETQLDPVLLDTSLLITKLQALNVPPLPPRLGELASMAVRPPPSSPASRDAKTAAATDWRPKADTLLATSSTLSGHTAPVVRIAVSLDQTFFVSGSYDGSCRVWELDQIETSSGVLESSIAYTGHDDRQSQNTARINDVAMVEGSHSVASAASNGSVHVWRVDSVSQKKQPSQVNTVCAGHTQDPELDQLLLGLAIVRRAVCAQAWA
ncbi:phosphoinositide-3-kinase, regulatory subunit 4 [Seminavis robusta]|uniref:non-specific serine/threonine protein kinase n=1 Tax=Seminavis robusta TaxID=568900 RepID=A0A9N8HLT8_9STRA|nr:phosphoinositide-3-kinase, regulatory subunit 4 [Seminavis robusta]|eukprot:Sro1058_g236440.1 phosphoinositide-3-kinase, regulatory subunit 4 (597) ;mRNA; r:36626-38525